MPWQASAIEMPETWWDALNQQASLPQWWKALVAWVESFAWTHVHTQTFRDRNSPWAARERYCRFLAAHSSKWMLQAALFAVEQHPGGHGSHMHALWNSPYDRCAHSLRVSSNVRVRPLYQIVKEQSARSIGYSRLWPIEEKSTQAVAYCLKYIVKGLRNLKGPRIPLPYEPQEHEPIWGIWESFAITPLDTEQSTE